MVDLRVLDGGNDGGKSRNHEIAKQIFDDFVVQILRSLTGSENDHRVLGALKDFLDHCREADVAVGLAISETLAEMTARTFDDLHGDEWTIDDKRMLKFALRVIVEHFATDGFAKGRLSSRETDLRNQIELMAVKSERRSNEHGWSYLGNLLKQAKRQRSK